MDNDAYEWQLATYRAARDRLYLGIQLTRTQVLRSQEQIRISLELLEAPLPVHSSAAPSDIQGQDDRDPLSPVTGQDPAKTRPRLRDEDA